MVLSEDKIKRLLIYFFYDKKGVVDDYIPYMLKDISLHCNEIFIVCNGNLSNEGKKKFLNFTDETRILVRENRGFDVWAYKEALEQYGWDKLSDYDEVILMNFTLFGPVYPFSEMFEEMNRRDLDFWGITKYHRTTENPFRIQLGYTPEHIQSHFIAMRSSLLKSGYFHEYWRKVPKINSYAEAVGKHEAIFTKYFNDLGFKSGVYVDTSDINDETDYPLMMEPVRMITEYRCPIVKRRIFFQNHDYFLSQTDARQARTLLDFLKSETNYDVDLIWDNLLRTVNLFDLKNSLNLNYILPLHQGILLSKEKKIALIVHLYFSDLIDYCYQYALSMPSYAHIYITTDTVKKKKAIEAKFSRGPWEQFKVILVENRGRDISSLLIGARQYLQNYELVCFMHDKKVGQLNYKIKGKAYSDRCYENMLGSKELVEQIINLFDKEPRLGLLCPPPPTHGDYYPVLGRKWGPNYEITKKLADELGITVDISPDKAEIAPLGTMFWFRPQGLKSLFHKEWTYEDFPLEPNKEDGTILHAVERLYSYAQQQAGYYTAWCMSDYYARSEWSNLYFQLFETNSRLFALFRPADFPQTQKKIEMLHKWGGLGIYFYRLKERMKRVLPDSLWQWLKRIIKR